MLMHACTHRRTNRGSTAEQAVAAYKKVYSMTRKEQEVFGHRSSRENRRALCARVPRDVENRRVLVGKVLLIQQGGVRPNMHLCGTASLNVAQAYHERRAGWILSG